MICVICKNPITSLEEVIVRIKSDYAFEVGSPMLHEFSATNDRIAHAGCFEKAGGRERWNNRITPLIPPEAYAPEGEPDPTEQGR